MKRILIEITDIDEAIACGSVYGILNISIIYVIKMRSNKMITQLFH